MSFSKIFWVVGTVAALAGCAGEQTITNPVTVPDSTPTPPQQPQPQPQPISHVGLYAATSGSSSGDGSASKPWDLATALSSARIHAGDTLWVRGGTYIAPFATALNGQAGKPIVIRAYPGERAIIDGGQTTRDNFRVSGTYIVVWGLEFTNSSSSRSTSIINHDYRADQIANNGP